VPRRKQRGFFFCLNLGYAQGTDLERAQGTDLENAAVTDLDTLGAYKSVPCAKEAVSALKSVP